MKLTLAICLVGLSASASLLAQTTPPSAQQMIDALRPPQTRSLQAPGAPDTTGPVDSGAGGATAKAPRTRSLRNLVIEQAAPEPTPLQMAPTPAALPATAAATVVIPVTAPATAAQSPVSKPSLSLLIQFDLNSARVRPESQQALTNLAQALLSSELESSRFAVEGHTDARGNPGSNLKLSQQRARAVRNLLVSEGVAGDRLVAHGKGASELSNISDPFAGENRRVRIVNLD